VVSHPIQAIPDIHANTVAGTPCPRGESGNLPARKGVGALGISSVVGSCARTSGRRYYRPSTTKSSQLTPARLSRPISLFQTGWVSDSCSAFSAEADPALSPK
jgi:hypothetical protein